MKFINIIQMLKHLSLPNVNPPLGRWNIHNYKQTMLKLKYANEDNCGISYDNYKNIKNIQQNNNLDDNKEYMYMMGYESLRE
jgi:hypothetical protein